MNFQPCMGKISSLKGCNKNKTFFKKKDYFIVFLDFCLPWKYPLLEVWAKYARVSANTSFPRKKYVDIGICLPALKLVQYAIKSIQCKQ